MDADEMFKVLGYEMTDRKISPAIYRYRRIFGRKKRDIKEIALEQDNKRISICYLRVEPNSIDLAGNKTTTETILGEEAHCLSIEEFKAIKAKIEELGWLGERCRK